MNGLYRSYLALLVMALVPIHLGANASLRVPKSVKKKWKELAGKDDKDSKAKAGEEDEDSDVERLTAEDAYLFPIIGSVVLLSLFFAFKYLDKALINKVLGGYLAIMGTGALTGGISDVSKRLIGKERTGKLDKYKVLFKKNTEEQFRFAFTKLHIFAVFAALALTVSQQYTQHWILSNLLALSFAYSSISLFYHDSFLTGSILLGGLFLYDIWFVFGTKAVFGEKANVMVSVAQNFDAPIKIVFPKDLVNARDFTLLGLGDIVLPGSFLSLALRFDYHQAIKRALSKSASPPRPTDRFPKPYYQNTFIAYIAALVTTIFVMHTFRAAQPALLYISPACVASVTLTALFRKEVKEVWGWEDGEEERKEREKKEQEEKDKKEKKEADEGEESKNGEASKKEIVEPPTAETTSIDIDGGRVLQSRA